MKKIYSLLVLCLFITGNAQIINFPDANFKAKLLEADTGNNIADYIKIDANNNGEIELNEASQVTSLNLIGYSISSIEGISNFNNLYGLDCSQNDITSLNLNALTNLVHLSCNFNQLSTLDLNGLVNLETLECYNNQISSLSINGLSSLYSLDCNINQLTSLQASNLTNLRILQCEYNQLTNLNVNGSLNITDILCQYNQLTTLDLSELKNLYNLYCANNQLISINIKNGGYENAFEIENNPDLQYICCDDSEINDVNNSIFYGGQTNCHVNSYCSFTPGGEFYTIQGNTKIDFDNNGCDSSDLIYSNLNLTITDGTVNGSLISNTSGGYSIPVVAGTHTITPVLENPSYFNISPSNITVAFPAQTSPFTQDFCITANGVHPDLEVTLLPIISPRPGFDATYIIIYKNKGNTTQSGSVNLTFDDAVLDFVSANPVIDSQTINNLSWNYNNLLPFETREITLTLNLNSPMETPAVNIGDQLNFRAEINPITGDETPYDNVSTIKQIVLGSYDPNDKTCLEGTTITPAMVGEYVHYVIRFENTGTFPAQNIVAKDMIDLAKFDINTLIPIKGSHEFVTKISDTNKVEFIFENINLPFDDTNNDGFVAFKIKTKSSLVVGDTFSNLANIYFDYNFPIVTNTATTTVQTLGTSDFEFSKYFTVYPNPASSTLNLSVKSGVSVNSIAIYNTLVQLVIAVPNAQSVSNIDVSNLKTGNYFIKIVTDKGTANTKFLKN